MSSRYTAPTLFQRSQFGDLYRATDSETGAPVVLRRFFDEKEVAADPDKFATLQRRTDRLAKFQHTNVAAVIGADHDGDGAFVVNEFVEGTILNDIVSNAALTVDDFRSLATHALTGLEAVHHHGLIHGSLKPNRVVLHWLPDQTALFKLTDIGLAELIGSADLETTDSRGRYNGSVDCLAPELFEGLPGDARSDLYAIGNVFYYALSQHLPFAAETAEATIANHQTGEPLPIQHYRKDLPDELAAWIMTLIAKDADKRPAGATAALHDLRVANGETPATPVPPSESKTEPATELLPVASAAHEEEKSEPEIPEHANDAPAPEQQKADTKPEPKPEPATPKTARVSVKADAADAAVTATPAPASNAQKKTKAPPTGNTAAKKSGRNILIPAIIAAVLVIGIGVFALLKFGGKNDSGASAATPAPVPSATPAAPPVTTAPAPPAGDPVATKRPAPPADLDINTPPVTEGLLGQFVFDLAENMNPIPAPEDVQAWPKRAGHKDIASLRVSNVDPAGGHTARRVYATPDTFLALNGPHPLLQLTGETRMSVEWSRKGEGFLSGDQLTYFIVMWSPEQNAKIIELRPPIRDEAAITTRITNRQLVSEIFHFDKKFPLVPYPNGNQMLAFSLIWAGHQDNARHAFMTPSLKRFASDLSRAPNRSLLISSIEIGGDTSPLAPDKPSGVYFAELLVYDRTLSLDEKASVDAYLGIKYFRRQ